MSEENTALNAFDILMHMKDESMMIPGYSCRAVAENSGDSYRVVIECSVSDFFDSFNGIELSDDIIRSPETGEIRGISISCRVSEPHNFFMIVIDLLDYINTHGDGPDIGRWCESWKLIMGNKFANNRVYDVAAEMLVLSYLQSRNMNPVWSGPDHERHDIRCDSMDCEVKSTLSRNNDAVITISGGRQLVTEPRPVKLFVCQMEHSANGILSVSMLKKDLISKGMDRSELSEQFRKTGLNSTSDQKAGFNLIFPIKVYDIDQEFPVITEKSFKGNLYPPHLVNISYSITLAGLKYSEIEVSLTDGGLEFTEKDSED